MYSETISDILVFKTNIDNNNDVTQMSLVLDKHNLIKRWNIDHDDCDHVLRIESDHLDATEIIHLVEATGFMCEELPD